MKRALIHWSIDVAAWCVMALTTPGFTLPSWSVLIVIAGGLFASLSATARLFFWLLVCPLSILTIAPLVFGLNALLIWLSTCLSGRFGVDVSVGGLGPLVIGTLIVITVRAVLVMCANAYESQRAFKGKHADLLRLEKTKRGHEQQLASWKALAEEWDNALKQS